MGTEITRESGPESIWVRRKATRGTNGVGPRTAGETSAKGAPVHYSETQRTEKDPLTQSLGWFSIGLGAAEVFAPQAVARMIGLDEGEHAGLLRAYGLRELAAGIGILTRPKPTYWMWNRVIGDAVDLASLGKAMRSPGNDKTKLATATVAVLGVTALDILCSVALTSERSPAAGHDAGSFTLPTSRNGALPVTAVVTVNRPVEEVYGFWKNPANFSRFMDQIESVTVTSARRTHWKVKAPAGFNVEWDAELVTDVPNEMLSWRSVDGGDVDNTGTVTFRRASGDRGTEVELEMDFKPKGGPVGERIARLFLTVPKTHAMNDLRRFKQIIEIGEVVQSDASVVKGMHPARPPKYNELEA
jgi:uncharacterized membrane protein